MTQAANDNITATFRVGDLSTEFDSEPRVLDVLLGERLGMAQPTDIRRNIIKRAAELSSYGKLCTVSVQTSAKGGRPGTAYYLNEPQALLICMFANTAKAAEVRKMLIDVFMEYRRSQSMVKVQAHERRTSTRIDDAIRLRTNIDRLERVTADIATLATPRYLTAMVVDGEPVVVDVNDYMMEGDDEAVILKWDGSLEITKPVNVVLQDNRFHNDDVSMEEGRRSYSRVQLHGERSGYTPFRKQGSMTVRDGCVILGKVIRSATPPRPGGETRLLDAPARRTTPRLPAPRASAVESAKRRVAVGKMAVAGKSNKEIVAATGAPYSTVAAWARAVRLARLGRVA